MTGVRPRTSPPVGGAATSGGSPNEQSIGDDAIDWAAVRAKIRRLAAVIGDADMDPDDLAQDAVERLLHVAGHSPVSDAYLFAVVRRRVLELRRKAGRRRQRLSTVDLGLPTTQIDQHLVEWHGVFEHLKVDDRAIVYLSIIEGWTAGEIANAVGLSEAAVRKRMSRAKSRFARMPTSREHWHDR